MSQAVKNYESTATTYMLTASAEWMTEHSTHAKEARITWVSGLLLNAFLTCKEKPDLRSKVLSYLSLLGEISASELPAFLYKQCDLAKKFQAKLE